MFRNESLEEAMAKYKHLTLKERIEIQSHLDRNLHFNEIAKLLGKDASTISKEVKRNLVIKKTGHGGQGYNPCARIDDCHELFACPRRLCYKAKRCSTCGKCIEHCPRFVYKECPKLSKTPYCCNGCEKRYRCHLTKRLYDAEEANNNYKQKLSESRKGFLISMEEAGRIGDLLYPLIYQGHSVYHACLVLKDQLMLSEKTIYSYIEGGVLNIKNIDLPRKVRYRQRKKPREFKVDKGCRIGRSYDNYLTFMEENENPAVVQMDSVKGDMSGKVLLTIHFVETGFMLAFIREQNTAKSVTDIFNKLYEELGRELFMKLFPVILTDNGSEFSDPLKIEFDENGERRTNIFYCDQNRSDQKGSIEVNHEFIRRISPKGKSFNPYCQEDIDKMMSHINSYKRKRLNNQSPYTAFSLFYGSEIPQKLGIEEIPADEIKMSPELLKK